MKRLVSLVVVCALLSGCARKQPVAKAPAPPTPPPIVQLAPPTLLSPPPDAAYHAYPRTLSLQWAPVQGAARYGVEVDCYGCCASHQFCRDVGRAFVVTSSAQTGYTFDFVGDQPGRWRVWAIAPDGTAGPTSEWRLFTFGRVVGASILPPAIPPVSPNEFAHCDPGFHSVRLPPGTTPPTAIYNPDPEYSEQARKDKLSGSVILGVRVGADGSVTNVCVLRSLRSDLDANAVAAVRLWRFQAARKDGAAIPADLTVETVFRLQ